MKSTALLVAKVVVSVGLLAYLFSTTDLTAFEERVRNGDLLLLAVAAALYGAMLALATWRWLLLLRAQGYPAPLRQLTASYLVATFFNNFLPSNIGGDVVRIRDGSKLTGSTTASLAIVAIDRILGFGALYALALLAFLTGGPSVRELAGARAVILGLSLVFGLVGYVYLRPGMARRVMAASGLASIPWAKERFETVQTAVHAYRSQKLAVCTAFGASVALQALVVCYFFVVARSLEIALPLSACFLIVPLCTLVQAIPISFNGWGLRETAFILYFGQVGLSRDSALACSLVGAGLIVLLSLSGAVVWTSRSRGV